MTDATLVKVSAGDKPPSPEEKRRVLRWAQRVKGVFGTEITTCRHYGGRVRIGVSIEEPTAIRAIFGHFEKHDARQRADYRPAARATPAATA